VVNRRGFTLIEVTVVITILVILSALLSTRIVAMLASRQVQSFIDGLPRIATQAREAAITQGQTAKLTYDQSQQTLHVAAEQSGQPDKTVADLSVPSNVQLDSFQLAGQTSGAGDFTLRFYPDGHSDGGGIETNSNGSMRSLVVDTNGLAKLVNGPLPAASQDTWTAGDFVHRNE